MHEPTAKPDPNPVETARNIAFANALNHLPKSPLREQNPEIFQEEGTANERDVETRKVG
jgi:hypothetical protein